MVYECKQQTIIYNGNQHPFRYIKCDDEMVNMLRDRYVYGSATYYNTLEEALHDINTICPIVTVATGTYDGDNRSAYFGNTNTMINEGKFYYVGTFYGTQGNIINMTGKIYNSNNTKYVDYSTISSNNLFFLLKITITIPLIIKVNTIAKAIPPIIVGNSFIIE